MIARQFYILATRAQNKKGSSKSPFLAYLAGRKIQVRVLDPLTILIIAEQADRRVHVAQIIPRYHPIAYIAAARRETARERDSTSIGPLI